MKKEIVLLGDSITQGLGSKKVNFTSELQKSLGTGYAVDNMAFTGTTVHYLEQIFDEILQKKASICCYLVWKCRCTNSSKSNGLHLSSYSKTFSRGRHVNAASILFPYVA